MADEPLTTDAIQASYDAVAEAYAEEFFDELSRKPFDRELLDRFAASCARGGLVLDVGCGPGHVANYLMDDGVEAAGIDLSPEMIEVARRLTPRVAFTVGDMRHLPWADGALGGLTAFYSLIHIPRADVPSVLAEFRRVLAPEGRLLVAVHGGSGTIHRDRFLEHDVPFEATLFALGELVTLVEAAGFRVDTAHQRPPYEFEHPTMRVYVAAHAVAGDPDQLGVRQATTAATINGTTPASATKKPGP